MRTLLLLLAFLVITSLLVGESLAKGCGKRRKVNFGKSLTSRGRPVVKIKKTTKIRANNGSWRTLKKGAKFFSCGCDKGGTCVVYGDKPGPAFKKNSDGTTFFANIPASRITPKRSRTRGAVPLKGKPTKVVRRKIIATDIRGFQIWHGPGAPMWEYTYLGGGKLVTGAESPASYYRGGKKLGKGYNTGLFRTGRSFYDVCAPIVKTRVRPTWLPVAGQSTAAKGPGSVEWVLGYYIEKKGNVKVWAWMIQKIRMSTLPNGAVNGNIK
jgi:hypothetical protein